MFIIIKKIHRGYEDDYYNYYEQINKTKSEKISNNSFKAWNGCNRNRLWECNHVSMSV